MLQYPHLRILQHICRLFSPALPETEKDGKLYHTACADVLQNETTGEQTMRMRKKAHLDRRMERQSARLIQRPEEHRGRWRELLDGCEEVRLELGCGKGRFTVETAKAEPEVLFVAVERVADAMVMAMERAEEAGLSNVYFIDADARGLDGWFAPGEVSRVYLNFSDPWPSNRQAKRRLTHPDFLRLYAKVLSPGGEIHFKTDNQDLFAWSLFQFPKAGYALEQVTRDLHAHGVNGVMTDYEEKFYREGKPICRCVAVKGETLSARLTLVEPQPEHEAAVWAYRQCFQDVQEPCVGAAGLEDAADYAAWRAAVTADAVKGNTFIAMDAAGEMAGALQIRQDPDETAGQILLSVRPDRRRRGYAVEMLGLALAWCGEALGLEQVLLTCGEDNVPAARAIAHYKAQLEDRVSDGAGGLIRRYRVTV